MSGFLIGIALVALLSLRSPFPYWPSLIVAARSMLASRIPVKQRAHQFSFVVIQLLMAPIRGAASMADDLLFSGYRKVVIEPIFIIGEPRCGSTLLHRTMAQLGRHLAIRHYEWRYPFVIMLKAFRALGIDQLIAARNYWPNGDFGTQAAKMHPNKLSDWEEDGIFFEENFSHHFFMFLRFPYRRVLEKATLFGDLPDQAKRKFIQEHKKAIQKIAYSQHQSKVSYLSKEVVSHDMVPFLMNEYPDAQFIVVVRESSEFLSSLIALVAASTGAKNSGFDPTQMPWWQDSVVMRLQEDCQKLVRLCTDILPAERQHRIASRDLFLNIDSAVSGLYRSLGIDLSDDLRAQLRTIQLKQASRQRGYTYRALQPAGFDEYDTFVQSVYHPSSHD